LQTLAGAYIPETLPREAAIRFTVQLEDGDKLVLHDDCPAQWSAGDRVALLIHGLTGSHRSPYLVRTAQKLFRQGVRVFRLDLRGCGAGHGLACMPYHSGRSEDAAAALRCIARLTNASPTSLVGFSLGGNIALKLAGELGANALPGLDSVLAICPPIDLAASAANMNRWPNRLYDRRFVLDLMRQVERLNRVRADSPRVEFATRPRKISEFDDLYTAPVCGFGNAAAYYQACSAKAFLPRIALPTLIMAAEDDPLIPVALFHAAELSSQVDLKITTGGGHLGYIGRSGFDPDRRWIEWRIVAWICGWHAACKRTASGNTATNLFAS
jgi:hypothetical protein